MWLIRLFDNMQIIILWIIISIILGIIMLYLFTLNTMLTTYICIMYIVLHYGNILLIFEFFFYYPQQFLL